MRDAADIGYYPEGQTIFDADAASLHLFVIIRDRVGQYSGDELVATFGPDDCPNGRTLVAGEINSRFIATEEVVIY